MEESQIAGGIEMIIKSKTTRKRRSSIRVNNDLPLNLYSVVSKEPGGQSGPRTSSLALHRT